MLYIKIIRIRAATNTGNKETAMTLSGISKLSRAIPIGLA